MNSSHTQHILQTFYSVTNSKYSPITRILLIPAENLLTTNSKKHSILKTSKCTKGLCILPRSLCFTEKTDDNFDKWHEKSDSLQVPRNAKCWNMGPCISFAIISPDSYRLQKHQFVFNSQMLQTLQRKEKLIQNTSKNHSTRIKFQRTKGEPSMKLFLVKTLNNVQVTVLGKKKKVNASSIAVRQNTWQHLVLWYNLPNKFQC